MINTTHEILRLEAKIENLEMICKAATDSALQWEKIAKTFMDRLLEVDPEFAEHWNETESVMKEIFGDDE